MKQNLAKTACKKCQSSDGLQPYLFEDGHIEGHCFSCGWNFKNLDQPQDARKRHMTYGQVTKEQVSLYAYRDSNDRGILTEISQRFGVRKSVNEVTGETDTIYYPYHIADKLSGYKVRVLPKDFEHASVGSIKNADMFGKHLCTVENKRIFVTEGEEDALALCQILWNKAGKKKFPNVVSLKNGAGISKGFDRDARFLNKFERVIACLDSDEAGIKGYEHLAEHVDHSRLYCMVLPEKDVCECLKSGKESAVIEAYKNAAPYRPGGFFKASERAQEYLNYETVESISYPDEWSKLNEATHGVRFGEIDVFTSGSGNGKTQIFRELTLHLLKNTKYKLALLSLEEPFRHTYEGLLGLVLNKRLNFPGVRKLVTSEEMEAAMQTIDLNRLCLYDQEKDINIFSTIKYLALVEGCKFIMIDHLQMLLPQIFGKKSDMEKIDEVMYQLRRMALQYNVWIGLIVHLRKNQGGGTSFEMGAVPTEDDLKGSGNLSKLPNGIYAIQRNRRHTETHMQTVMCIHVLKQRYTGQCGAMDYLNFDQITGRLSKIPKPEFSLIDRRAQMGMDNNF